MEERDDTGRTLGLLAGGALVVLGGWFLLSRLGLVPPGLLEVWSRVSWPIALIVVGAVIVVAASRGALRVRGPLPGARLYRSRSDKWVEGVLGGLGAYLGIDPVILRLVFLALVLAGWWGLVLAYVIMAIVVPKEPQ